MCVLHMCVYSICVYVCVYVCVHVCVCVYVCVCVCVACACAYDLVPHGRGRGQGGGSQWLFYFVVFWAIHIHKTTWRNQMTVEWLRSEIRTKKRAGVGLFMLHLCADFS